MSLFPLLQSPRLSLRELVANDAPAIFAIHSDANAMRWFGCDVMADLAAASQLIEIFASWRSMPNPGTRWGIEYQGQIIGSCGLFKWDKNGAKPLGARADAGSFIGHHYLGL
jgi:ribosomal-protein-alanine N-acetyltransferase